MKKNDPLLPLLFFLAIVSPAFATDGPIAHWKLTTDARDTSGADRHAINHGVAFHGPTGAIFDEIDSWLEVPADKTPQLAAQNGPRVLEVDAFAIQPVDSIADKWQTKFFGPRFLCQPLAGPDQDPDRDGSTNEEEFVHGTNPIERLSGLTASRMAPVISWKSVPGATYRIIRADPADPANFVVVTDAFRATDTVSNHADLSPAKRSRFYLITME